jgi:hypothetical protein
MNQFSIREVLLVFVIFAVAIGWWVDRRSGPTRFEMHVTTNHAYVLDKVTGQVWHATINPDNGGYFGDQVFTGVKLPE